MTDLTNHTEIVKDALEKCAAFRAAFPWPDDQPLSMDIDDRAVGDLFAEAQTLRAECQRLREALESICQYGSDTLSGRIDGPDDSAWYLDGVREMTKRARVALNPAKDEG